ARILGPQPAKRAWLQAADLGAFHVRLRRHPRGHVPERSGLVQRCRRWRTPVDRLLRAGDRAGETGRLLRAGMTRRPWRNAPVAGLPRAPAAVAYPVVGAMAADTRRRRGRCASPKLRWPASADPPMLRLNNLKL